VTVKELRDKLAKLDDKAKVVVRWERDDVQDLFEIDDVSTSKGTPKRIDDKAGFEYKSEGEAEWVFLSIEPA
jgi:hypothetical protein